LAGALGFIDTTSKDGFFVCDKNEALVKAHAAANKIPIYESFHLDELPPAIHTAVRILVATIVLESADYVTGMLRADT
jgi:hypothetical protein